MKRATAALALILALLLALPLLASCADTGNTEDTTEAPNAVTSGDGEQTTSPYDENGFLLDSLPELNYGDDEIHIICWEAERDEFEITEEQLNGSFVPEAIYNRNLNTEARMHVKLVWQEEPGNNNNIDYFVGVVEKEYAGGNIYDMIATYTRTAGTLLVKGYYQDLNKIEDSYLDFSKPWWPPRLLETMRIGDGLYFVSGDISTNLLHFMYAIYYNKVMLNDLNLEDPVKLVDDHTWTIDKLIEMSKDRYIDSDNSGALSEGDTYGFCSIYYHLDAFYTGSGLRLIEQSDDDLLVISEDFNSDKCIAMCDKIASWMKSGDCYISSSQTTRSYQVPFVNGNALFCQNRVYMADQQNGCKLHDVTWDYGILPTPLYDLDQENYITVVGNPFTLWGIEKDLSEERTTEISAVMECLCSNGYRYTTPALFETNMKYRYTPDSTDGSMRMFDIIHDTIDFDLGRIFSRQDNYMSEMPTKIISDGGSWGAVANAQTKTLRTLIKNQIVKPITEAYG